MKLVDINGDLNFAGFPKCLSSSSSVDFVEHLFLGKSEANSFIIHGGAKRTHEFETTIITLF